MFTLLTSLCLVIKNPVVVRVVLRDLLIGMLQAPVTRTSVLRTRTRALSECVNSGLG